MKKQSCAQLPRGPQHHSAVMGCALGDTINGEEGDGDLQTVAVVAAGKETVLAALVFGRGVVDSKRSFK